MSINFGKSQYVVEMVEMRITFKVTPPFGINHRQDEFAQIALSKKRIQYYKFLLYQK